MRVAMNPAEYGECRLCEEGHLLYEGICSFCLMLKNACREVRDQERALPQESEGWAGFDDVQGICLEPRIWMLKQIGKWSFLALMALVAFALVGIAEGVITRGSF